MRNDKEYYAKRDRECFVARDKSFERGAAFVVVEGHGSIVRDIEGNEYLDFATPSAIVGHNHPRVVDAMKKQIGKLTHFVEGESILQPQLELAEAIKAIAPGSLKSGKLVFGCSGTDAVEFALKLVRYRTEKPVVLSFIGGHHGRTPGTLPFTADYSRSKLHHYPYVVESAYVPYPHCYRCVLGQTYPECSLACLEFVNHFLDQVVPPEAVAAILVEPLLSWSGFAKPPDDYIPKLRKLCTEKKILFVDDEVFTGFGRTGKMFAIEHYGVEPDLICLGKPMGAGMPLGAMIAKSEIIDNWETGKRFTSSSAGNLLACVSSLTALQIIKDEKLDQRAQKLGQYLLGELKDRFSENKWVGDIRGMGLLSSIEFVKDKETKEPNSDEAKRVFRETFKRGIVLNQVTGAYHQIVRIVPPLTVSEAQLERLLDVLSEVLKDN